jgi:REP element-mobilizing transposase RayT
MAHTYTRLLSQFIFSTKNREPGLADDVRPRLFPYLGGIIRELDGHAIIVNGPADHVHLLCTLPPTTSLSDVEQYIQNHEEHHRTVSFQDEFLAFLKRHGIQYEPRYIWE